MNKQSECFAGAVLALCAFVAGCQRYIAKPPDLASHHAAWLERTAQDERVADYAQRLAEAGVFESAFDLSDGVTLAEAEVIALVLNADLRVSRAEAGVALASFENAGLWEDPMLGVDVMRILSSVPHPWISMASVGFTIPISGRLGGEKALAQAEHAQALQQVAATEWETVIALRQAWIKWSAAEEDVAITRNFLVELGELVDIVEHMLTAGEMNRLETRLFQIEELGGEQLLASLEGTRDQLALELRRLMGLAPTADIELVPIVRIAASHSESQADAADVMARNPRLRSMLAAYESAERALELEIRKQYPDITIGPGHQYEDGRHRVGFGVSMPLPIFNANRLAVAEAMAKREKAMAELENALESVLAALAGADVQRAAAFSQRAIVEEKIVPLVDAQFDDARAVARLGEVDTLLLLETLRKQFEVKRQLVNLVYEESKATVERERIIGPMPLPPVEMVEEVQ